MGAVHQPTKKPRNRDTKTYWIEIERHAFEVMSAAQSRVAFHDGVAREFDTLRDSLAFAIGQFDPTQRDQVTKDVLTVAGRLCRDLIRGGQRTVDEHKAALAAIEAFAPRPPALTVVK